MEDQRVQGQLQEENGGPPAAKQREGRFGEGSKLSHGQGKNERRNPEPGDRDWANKLNLFFNRFDTGPTSTPLSLSTDQPTSSSLCLHAPSPPSTPPPSLGLSPSPPPSPPSLQCSSPPPPLLS
ncbi:hypothetical protein L3Q82_006112 [Scortum barcoo]|uniref:Uncharacterized protein n=1 Tax=Scortum barcoo TaxID=214431 RepID=A0ACB8X2G1_9TELE|nr:hypothetical protein L3Q82_006112 [Scortum barcoo]